MRRHSPGAAFSLVELLVVLAIIGTICAFLLPAGGTMMMASRLTDGLNRVESAFNYARHIAIAHNHAVEIRFYQYGDPEVPGEQANVPTSGRYRAIQVFEYLDNGEAVPITKVDRLPDGISFDSGLTLSPLLASSQAKTFTGTSGLDPQVSLPRGVNLNYNCAAFQILRSGMTNLSLGNWFVTMHKDSDGDGLAAPKGNYATVQIDPVSGAARHYRP